MEEIAELHELRRKDIGKLNRCKLEMTKYKIGIEKFFGPTFNYADGDFYDEIQSASLVVCDH